MCHLKALTPGIQTWPNANGKYVFIPKEALSTHLHLRCKWWIFVIKMIHYQSICKKNRKVTTPQTHDTASMMQHALTRSVGVICLSRYLQHLTLTGSQMLKHYNYLITNSIYRDRETSRTRLCKYRAIPACNRDNSMLTNGTIKRLTAPVTQTPSTAEPLALMLFPTKKDAEIILTLHDSA